MLKLMQQTTASCYMFAGLWKQVYNSEGKVKDIYFYRQMSADELHSKVHHVRFPCSYAHRHNSNKLSVNKAQVLQGSPFVLCNLQG